MAFLSPKEVILNHFHNPVKWILMTACVLVVSSHVAACGIAAVPSSDNPQHHHHSGSPQSLTDPGLSWTYPPGKGSSLEEPPSAVGLPRWQ